MCNESIRYLICNALQHCDIVSRKVLDLLLVGDLEAADGIVAQLDRHDQEIPGYCMQLLVKIDIFTHLFNACFGRAVLEVHMLTHVENI